MNKFTFDGSWDQLKARLRQKYAMLTDDDLHFVEGQADELLGRLESRLGMGADELDDMLDNLKRELDETSGTMHAKFEAAKQKVAEVAHDVKAKATVFAGELKAGAAEQAEHLKARAEEVYGDARHKVRTWREEGEACIREQPRTAVLAALAAGFMIGLLVRR